MAQMRIAYNFSKASPQAHPELELEVISHLTDQKNYTKVLKSFGPSPCEAVKTDS